MPPELHPKDKTTTDDTMDDSDDSSSDSDDSDSDLNVAPPKLAPVSANDSNAFFNELLNDSKKEVKEEASIEYSSNVSDDESENEPLKKPAKIGQNSPKKPALDRVTTKASTVRKTTKNETLKKKIFDSTTSNGKNRQIFYRFYRIAFFDKIVKF